MFAEPIFHQLRTKPVVLANYLGRTHEVPIYFFSFWSSRWWRARAGLRYLAGGGSVLRYLCRKCGYRFSFGQNSKGVSDSNRDCQVGVILQDAKNLDSATEIETVVGERQKDIKGIIFQYMFWSKKQGYRPTTIKWRAQRLEALAKRGADLDNPESVKKIIALQDTWCDSSKALAVDAYTSFLNMEGKSWKPPRYTIEERIPFIPTEAELNMLIGACNQKFGTFLQGLKETGADPGELAAITPKDVNKEAGTVTINKPVKGHRPRMLTVSRDLIKRLEKLYNGSERIFDDEVLRRAFYYKRKTSTKKLSNPRLMDITFITFRHWFGTMEYHRTKDILHVQRLLGHKSIQNTLIYIDLESKIFQGSNTEEFTTRVAQTTGEACSLIEAGFEYVTGDFSDGGRIFRKRL